MDKIAIMNEAREEKRLQRDAEVKRKAEICFAHYKKEPLFTAGIMLYWAEGKTTQRAACTLELNNSDPKLLKLYCSFIRRYLDVDDAQLRGRLFLYPDLDERKTKLFWSDLLNIPLNQFIKSYISNSRSSVTKNKLRYGTCSVYINNKHLRIAMATWIEQFAGLYT